MSPRKSTPLGAALIATKGAAIPAAQPVAPSAAPQARIPLTIKLTLDRYDRLKELGAKLDRTSQAILVEALDAYLRKHA